MTPADTTTSERRFRELDGLRGIAALAVVCGHLTATYDSMIPGQPPPFYTFTFGAFGVQLFFLISGFVILMSARRATRDSDFVISRVSRLYPTYWIGLTLTSIIALSWSLWPWPGTMAALTNLTMVQRWLLVDNVDPVYWTLAVEMQFYLLLFLLLILTRCTLNTRIVLTTLSLWMVIAVAVAVTVGDQSRGIAPDSVATPAKILLNVTLAEFAPLFSAGCLAYLARRREISAAWPVAASGAAVGVALLLHSTSYAAAVLVVCTVFMVVVARPVTRVLLVGPIQWLGRVSYSLYIFHAAFGELVVWTLTPRLGRDAAMVAALTAVLVSAAVIHEVGEVRGTAALKRALLAGRARLTRNASVQ